MKNEYFSSIDAANAGVIPGVDDFYSASRKVAEYRAAERSRNTNPKDAAKAFGILFTAFMGIGSSVLMFAVGMSEFNYLHKGWITTSVLVPLSALTLVATVRHCIKSMKR